MDNFLQQFNFASKDLSQGLPSFDQDDYIIEPSLYEAVKLALVLKQPLLLTGKPGTGKTNLAYKLAHDLHTAFPTQFLPAPLVFTTKTTSSYTDLFYSYDALSHFHAANFNADENVPRASEFIQLQALGQAIVLSGGMSTKYKPTARLEEVYRDTIKPWSSVVLIDEVDKAPRDFTNDLLNELERLEFTVKEDENAFFNKGEGTVLVVLTSNSEKNLPDAFLRRCLFYHIDFPSEELLRAIVLRRLFPGGVANDKIGSALDTFLNYFTGLQNKNLKKQPATAELISWVYFLRSHISAGVPWPGVREKDRVASLSILAKFSEDLALLKQEINSGV